MKFKTFGVTSEVQEFWSKNYKNVVMSQGLFARIVGILTGRIKHKTMYTYTTPYHINYTIPISGRFTGAASLKVNINISNMFFVSISYPINMHNNCSRNKYEIATGHIVIRLVTHNV